MLDGAVMGVDGADWHFVRTIVYRTGDAPRRHPHRGLKLSRERELLVPATLMGWHWLGRCRELISDPLIVTGGPETTNGHAFLSPHRSASSPGPSSGGNGNEYNSEYVLHTML